MSDAPEKTGFFARLKAGLAKSATSLSENLTGIFTKQKLDAETVRYLEDALVRVDLGTDLARRVTQDVAKHRYDQYIAPYDLKFILADALAKILKPSEKPFHVERSHKPFVVLVAGVNGTGKTTTIGKIADRLRKDGFVCMLAAGDTFRAAAIEQLQVWGERTGSDVVARAAGADAAGLAYDALVRARETKADVLLIDTAGRLQNKAGLMAELEKIVRVMRKVDATAPHAVLLVLDATTGQNALSQVEAFKAAVPLTGLVMTKLDGTARGGILVALADKFGLPVHFIGVGEAVSDLQPFNAQAFANALTGAS
ncbi:MAG TPA: signal recognition particle-docking protein FtsY [Rhizomicrobium sp.]|nr:signal recognition particle-docking protein FtsY [Rhizomicrobium sp.]